MIDKLWLRFTLESEACFSRGDGVPGVVDVEVNHDEYGLPYLGGRTLKGLLHAEATEIVDALRHTDKQSFEKWARVANDLFGQPGSFLEKEGKLHVGDAQLPADLRSQVATTFDELNTLNKRVIHPHDVLETLTTIRRQTAVDSESGSPKEETLRAVRVILRKTEFVAPLLLKNVSTEEGRKDELAFLAACIKAFRRAGSNKTRGYGRLRASLHESLEEPAITKQHFRRFKEAL